MSHECLGGYSIVPSTADKTAPICKDIYIIITALNNVDVEPS